MSRFSRHAWPRLKLAWHKRLRWSKEGREQFVSMYGYVSLMAPSIETIRVSIVDLDIVKGCAAPTTGDSDVDLETVQKTFDRLVSSSRSNTF
jgi:hypothetical protein